MQTVEVTRTAKQWLDEDGILRVVTFPGVVDTVEDAKENMAVGIKVSGSKTRPALLDMRAMKSQSREVRAYYNESVTRRKDLALAIGILVESPISRIIGNFYLGFNRADVPVRLFKSEDEALAWLKGFVE